MMSCAQATMGSCDRFIRSCFAKNAVNMHNLLSFEQHHHSILITISISLIFCGETVQLPKPAPSQSHQPHLRQPHHTR